MTNHKYSGILTLSIISKKNCLNMCCWTNSNRIWQLPIIQTVVVDLSLDIPQQFCSRGVKTKDGEQLRCTLSGEHMFNTI